MLDLKKRGEKMKNTHKKLIGGLLVGMLIATIGAALATGQTDETTENESSDTTDYTPPQFPYRERQGLMGIGPCGSELTDEQQTELEELLSNLRDQNATAYEIRTAIQEKLDEFGVFDTRLDNEIAQTEQRLTVLNRQKELRDEGYTWDEINSIIEEEFSLENATGMGWNKMDGHGFRHGPCGGQLTSIPSEESYQ